MNLVEALVPRFRRLAAEMEARERFYAMPKPKRDEIRLAMLNVQWACAAAGSAYYAEVMKERRLPPRFSSLEEFQSLVPLTPKAALRQSAAAFKLPGSRRGQWMLTGGSTGSPASVFWGLSGHLESLRDQYFARTWWGVQPFDRMAMLWGHSHSFGSGLSGMWRKCIVPVIDRLRRRMRLSAYSLDPETLRRYYDQIARFRPASLYAYASAAHLLAAANRDRQPLPRPLKVVFMAAEPILEPFRQSVREVFGCPCAGEYGSIECGMMAYEHPDGFYRVFERSVILETIEGEGGYEIIVTQLRGTGFPLFRYRIGDMAKEPLAQGPNGWEQLITVKGRSNDMLKSPSGRVCHSEVLTHLIERVPHVLLFSATQRADYSVVVELQPRAGTVLGPEAMKWVNSQLQRVLGRDVPVEVKAVESLERTLAGKHRWIVSDVR